MPDRSRCASAAKAATVAKVMHRTAGDTFACYPLARCALTGDLIKANSLRVLADPTRFERATFAFGGRRFI